MVHTYMYCKLHTCTKHMLAIPGDVTIISIVLSYLYTASVSRWQSFYTYIGRHFQTRTKQASLETPAATENTHAVLLRQDKCKHVKYHVSALDRPAEVHVPVRSDFRSNITEYVPVMSPSPIARRKCPMRTSSTACGSYTSRRKAVEVALVVRDTYSVALGPES
jgi:hypothetical protein